MNRGLLYIAVAVAGVLAVVAAWKARDIRSSLSMMGEGWTRLHPQVQARAVAVVEQAAAAGITVGVFEGYRSAARQADLIASGASRVGDPDSSYHRWGLAVDFVPLDALGRWTWAPEGGRATWDTLGRIIEAQGFEWGGRFASFFDGPHAQYPIMRIAALKAAYGSPEQVTWG